MKTTERYVPVRLEHLQALGDLADWLDDSAKRYPEVDAVGFPKETLRAVAKTLRLVGLPGLEIEEEMAEVEA